MSNHSKMIDDLKDMNDESYVSSSGFSASSFLPSSMLNTKEKEEKKLEKKKKKDKDKAESDDWFNNLMSFNSSYKGDSKHNKKFEKGIFDDADGKKKKKKKKKNGEFIDYKAEFAPEMALYKNLLRDQDAFTKTLQKEYDAITSTKSSSRGITKQMTDLIDNITSARTLSMQLIEKNVNAKKLIAELNIKQKKELGNSTGDGLNMADFGSNYIKQMLSERQALLSSTTSDPDIAEYDDDDSLLAEIDSIELGDDNNENIYLQYEKLEPKVYVCINDNDIENYYFIAKDKNGNDLPDYPMPIHYDISVNKSTGIATDKFGNKYPIIWL